MKVNVSEYLIKIIENSIEELGWGALDIGGLSLEPPTDIRFGDLSTNIALRLGKALKENPLKIASDIVTVIQRNLEKSPLKDYVHKVKCEGAGFINFYLENKFFYEYLRDIIIKDDNAIKPNLGKGMRVLIEFVSANPTGPLSVAHARQAAVGDVLGNIFEFSGFKIKREYYLNDEGNQINILGESVKLRLKELEGEKIEFPENYYQGEYIYDIARHIKDKGIKISNYSDFAVKYILKIIKQELNDFGVKFDFWYSQKKLRESGKIERALKILKKKGFTYEKDGAVWFRSSEFGDDKDRVVVKSDGTYTYLAPDIAYHLEKYRRGFKWLINLWGPDHHGYINRLKAAVKALGKKEDSLSVIIVQLASIFREGRPIQMSTRKGQYITLREVINEVGKDASRYFFLMRRTSSHLDFDLELAKKETPENPVYYVQYAYARIASILRNSTIKINAKKINLEVIKEKEEIDLIKKMNQFSYILNICVSTQDPYMLVVYMQELAESFHKFYDRHRVLGESEELTKGRLALIKATQVILGKGLDLLGVAKPDRM